MYKRYFLISVGITFKEKGRCFEPKIASSSLVQILWLIENNFKLRSEHSARHEKILLYFLHINRKCKSIINGN